MNVAITGGSGFIGQYIVRELIAGGHHCRCWYRPESHRRSLADVDANITWIAGGLGDGEAEQNLIEGADAVVHAGLARHQPGFRGTEGDIPTYATENIVGSLRLIDAAYKRGTPRFVFISTCAVHEVILDDRKLDEAHPSWPKSHYGAHKAAIEMFVHSYGFRHGYGICALRPTGVYGAHHLPPQSKWYALIRQAAAGDFSGVTERGGKEVHAADVARATAILLQADGIAGQAYNCYDRYISEQEVAISTARLAGQSCDVQRTNPGPKHEIDTSKLQALGMSFGGLQRLEETITQLMQ